MKHIHFNECHSTQEYLKVQAEQGQITYPALVSTEHQTNGIGRRGNRWIDLGGSLCFSGIFSLKEKPTLAPLEIGLYLIKFFHQQWNTPLALKWPNDILNKKDQKVGGILIHKLQDALVVGIGLNLFEQDQMTVTNAEYPVGHIFESELNQFSKKDISLNLYRFLLDAYEQNQFNKEEWNHKCIHLNNPVTITEDDKTYRGVFNGINADGAAILQTEEKIQTFYAGTLRFNVQAK